MRVAAPENSIFPIHSLDRNLVRWEEFLHNLTPVEKVGDMWFKRDDYFAPLGYGGVNGSKLRQLIWLIYGYYMYAKNPIGVVSGAVTGSPQHPMAAIVSGHYGLKYTSIIGSLGVKGKPTLELAAKYGAGFIHSKCGYAKVLEHVAFDLLNSPDYKDYFAVETNIVVNNKRNHIDRVKAFHALGGYQVNNIPENIETLIIPCGSGTSTISIFYGLSQTRLPNLKSIILMGIGNVGSKNIGFIKERLELIGSKNNNVMNLIHYNLNGTGYCKYEDLMPFTYHNIDFHPRYEGKCMNYLQQKHPEHFNDKTMFWIVGSEPKF